MHLEKDTMFDKPLQPFKNIDENNIRIYNSLNSIVFAVNDLLGNIFFKSIY